MSKGQPMTPRCRREKVGRGKAVGKVHVVDEVVVVEFIGVCDGGSASHDESYEGV